MHAPSGRLSRRGRPGSAGSLDPSALGKGRRWRATVDLVANAGAQLAIISSADLSLIGSGWGNMNVLIGHGANCRGKGKSAPW